MKKLQLRKETLSALNRENTQHVAGGGPGTEGTCTCVQSQQQLRGGCAIPATQQHSCIPRNCGLPSDPTCILPGSCTCTQNYWQCLTVNTCATVCTVGASCGGSCTCGTIGQQ